MTTVELPDESWTPAWRRFMAGVLLGFLVLAYCFVWTIQPGYGPDETRHYQYIRLLLDEHRLPLLVNGQEQQGAHSLHPPLYYLLVSPVFALFRGLGDRVTYLALKSLSPLILVGALLLFRATLRRVFPKQPFAASAALTVVALLPEFQLEAAVVNNDSLAIFFGSLLLWQLARTWDSPPSLRDALLTGLILAAFVNTKAQGWTLAPLWALSVGQRAVRVREPAFKWLRDLAAGYGLLLLLGTWWYVRNYQLYGQPVPLDFMGGAVQPHSSRTGELLTPLQVYTSGEVVTLGWRSTVGLFQSFWTQIDWISEEYRPAIFGLLLVLCLAALAGGLWRLWTAYRTWEQTRVLPGKRLPELTLLAVGFILNWLHTWFVATFLHLGFYQGGRYLMPSVFGAGALLAAGWDVLTPKRAQWAVVGALALGLIGFNVLCLVELITYLNPKYVH
jgi:hypothetical protein